jgi:hypothetical protein
VKGARLGLDLEHLHAGRSANICLSHYPRKAETVCASVRLSQRVMAERIKTKAFVHQSTGRMQTRLLLCGLKQPWRPSMRMAKWAKGVTLKG